MTRIKRKPGPLAAPWPPDTSLAEMLAWASRESAQNMLYYAEAARHKDLSLMDSYGKQLRAVVTRLEAWGRIKARQWAADKSANSK